MPRAQLRKGGLPDEAGIEFEKSVIRLPLYLPYEERPIDIMVFEAYLKIVRERPFINGLGYGQIEFAITEWELGNTYSRGLNANIALTLSKVTQPKSICLARQPESHFPALLVYSAIYDVYLDNTCVAAHRAALAAAPSVFEIPPNNVTLAFNIPFSTSSFSFGAGTCEGMRSISQQEFEVGAAKARAERQHIDN